MVIHLRHEQHGSKVACSEAEAVFDESKGWKRVQVAALLKAAPTPSVAVEPSGERNALIEQYVARFGKKPHHKKSDETIRKELNGDGS